ncbi:MAG: YiiX family permuted papain-like enzyme [Bdellovibrionota bacterium]
MKRILSCLLFVFSIYAYGMGSGAVPAFKDGDVILQTSTSSQSEAIQLATHSKWSHVGIIFHQSGKPYVYEARGPVGYRSLSAFINSGSGKKYLVRRYRGGLSSSQVSRMVSVARGFAGKPYDIYFGWDNSRIYCSELVWKIYKNALGVSVGQLEELGDFDLSHPKVQKILRERYGNNIPYDETVVSPEALAVNGNLVTIYQN